MQISTIQRFGKLFTVSMLSGALTLGGFFGVTAAGAEEVIKPFDGGFTITTAGWGHGRGMSQYGANEAAKSGLTADQILAFYYPGTTITNLPPSDTIRVWIKDDTDGDLLVNPSFGLTISDTAGNVLTLPGEAKYAQWRLTVSSNTHKLDYKNSTGTWVNYPVLLDPALVWTFQNTASSLVSVTLPNSNRTYRGTVALYVQGGQIITVNTVNMEEYLRSVVPSEMPASWKPEAVKAQAIAARSYSARYRANLAQAKFYDICDTTSCQVYKGATNEHALSNAAIVATAGQVLTFNGKFAWTEFSSSNGGYSVNDKDYPYLIAQPDPYDLAAKQYHTVKVTSATLQTKYSIGTLQSISLERDGRGQYGGRVTKVTLSGSSGSKSVAGTTFKSNLGLRETLFEMVGDPNAVLIAIESVTAKNTTWTGTARKPTVKVIAQGKTLVLNTDYSVSYSSNVSAGIGKVTVKGKGDYKGTLTTTFTIAPKNTAIKSVTTGKKKVTIKWKKVAASQKITGYKVSYRIKGKGAWKTKTLKASKSSVVIKGLKKKKRYSIKIATYKKASGKTLTTKWSAIKYSKKVK